MGKGVGKVVYEGVDIVAENNVKIQFNPKGYLGKGVDKGVDKGVNKDVNKNI